MTNSADAGLSGSLVRVRELLPHFVVLFLAVLVLNRQGIVLPSANEFIYLPYLAKQYDSSYLPNDWAFSVGWQGGTIFNVVFGPLTRIFSLGVAGWIGRIVLRSLALAALLALVPVFRIPRWMGTLAIVVWLVYGQGLTGDTSMIGTFEANCFSYALLLFSLKALAEDRDRAGAVLLGLCFSFHPGVGLWAVLAVGMALVSSGYKWRRLAKCAIWACLTALPGVVPLVPVLLGSSALSAADARFMALVHQRSVLDPGVFPRRTVAALFVLLLFNWFHYRVNRDDHRLRFLVWFQVWLGAAFAVGVVAYMLEVFQFVKFDPFRLFPVLTPLCFFFQIANAVFVQSWGASRRALLAVGVLALLGMDNVIGQAADRVSITYGGLVQKKDDARKAFEWIAQNTPPDAVVISPPWRLDSYYFTCRTQVANWRAPRLDRYGEWRQRIESLVGVVPELSGRQLDVVERQREEMMAEAYAGLTEQDISRIMSRYGGDYLVSKASYDYPVVFSSDTYKVYQLKGGAIPEPGPPNRGQRPTGCPH